MCTKVMPVTQRSVTLRRRCRRQLDKSSGTRALVTGRQESTLNVVHDWQVLATADQCQVSVNGHGSQVASRARR